MRCYSPLRYPGGKGKLYNYIKNILIENSLLGGTYIEPFAGGAGIAISLLLSDDVEEIIINDVDTSIYAFWHSIINYNDKFCKLIFDTQVSIEERERQKKVQHNPEKYSILDLGFSTFYLNRTNRSGIIDGGVIGGNSQKGKTKIDDRFNKHNLVNRIKAIERYKNKIQLFNQDAEIFICESLPLFSDKALVYLDPPYYRKGPELYVNYYSHEDHLSLSNTIKEKIEQFWIVSYDNAPEIVDMYTGFKKREYILNYSLKKRYQGTEVMFFCDNLKIPDNN